MGTIMGQVVCATMPVYYAQTGIFDILRPRQINSLFNETPGE